MVKAYNKVSMWPPAFRLVEPINLSLNSNPHTRIPIHIFFVGESRSNTRLQTANQCSQEMDVDSEINMQTHTHSINLWLSHTIFNKSPLTLSPHTSLRLTFGVKSWCQSQRDRYITIKSSWLDLNFHLALTFTHTHTSFSDTLLLFSLLMSHIQDGPQLSFGILYSCKHHLWRCQLSPTTALPPASSSLINIRYIPTSARHTSVLTLQYTSSIYRMG